MDNSLPLKEQVKRFELEVIRSALKSAHFNRKETAARLGISVNTLWRKLGDDPENL
jgi:transcriptional regulator with PAS, ATPase and Fis domain